MTRQESEAKTRFEAVLLQMREMILSGQLPPGSRVQEIAVGEKLGVSRTPVRLSLSVLEQEGLVRGEPNRGFTVREFTLEEILGAYDVRSVLEAYACRVIAQRGLTTDEQIALDRCLGDGERLLSAGYFDPPALHQWSEMNGRFHAAIVQGADNVALAQSLNVVNQRPLTAPNSIVFRTGNLDRLFENMRQAQAEHATIVEALERRDVVRSEALMAEHIYQSKENVRREIQVGGPALSDFLKKLLKL